MRIGSLIRITGSGIRGKSSAAGFKLSYKGKSIASERWQEKGREKPEVPRRINWAIRIIGIVVSIIVFIILTREISFQDKMALVDIFRLSIISLCLPFLVGILFALYLVVIYILITSLKASERDWREYHACEHKTIGLIASKLPFTFENLNKMPRISLTCGTMLCVMSLAAPLLFPMAKFVHAFLSGWLGMVIFCGLSLLLMCGVSCTLQHFITTAELSEKKLRESLEVAKKFVQQI